MTRWRTLLNLVTIATSMTAGSILLVGPSAGEQTRIDCARLLVPHSTVAGHSVGETSCAVTGHSTFHDAAGQPWDRVDLALSGTAAGYADPVTVGNTRKDLTDVPTILYPQFGITQWKPGIGTYTGGPNGHGAGISVLYPADPAQWTGKTVVLVHGQANNTALGTLVSQPVGVGLPQDTFDNLYADEFVDAGYAVIYTRRPAQSGVPTVLDDGSRLDESVNDNIAMLRDFLQTGEALLLQVTGRSPRSVLWYGHSAGVIAGRLLNYSGLNDTPHGGHYVDGFLSDDPGGGLPLPLTMHEGQVLGVHDGHVTYPPGALLAPHVKAQMVPELTFAHGLYLDQHTWLPGITYLTLKQLGEQLDRESGLSTKTDLQVVAGVSHIPASHDAPAHTLDIGPLIQAAIPVLQSWVTTSRPPPTSSAGPPGDTNPAHQVQLPDIACPTGAHYPWPAPDGSSTQTGWIPFDGHSLEPVDARGALVDLDPAGETERPDGDGIRDAVPSMTTVWRHRGLLGPHQPLTRAAYVACVRRDVTDLQQRRLLTPDAAATYLQRAGQTPL